MRTGDTVKHKPTGEIWLVAYAENGQVCPCGWPESFAEIEDCELIKRGTDKERHALLLLMVDIKTSDSRQRYAKRILNI